jgi:hypothetical protein
MTRRDLMTLSTRALAAAGGAEFFSAWMRAAPPEPKFFTPAEFAVLQSFTEILIPSDETPGAREAQVAHYIDFVVNAAAEYAPETQQEWRKAMDWLTAAKFGALTVEAKSALVEEMAAPERDRSLKRDGFPVYRLIKQMTVFAFYTSRAGLIDNLEYKGNAYLTDFPACTHAEHRRV